MPFIQQNYQVCNPVPDIYTGCRQIVLFPALPVAGRLSDPTCCLLQFSAEHSFVTGSLPACSGIVFRPLLNLKTSHIRQFYVYTMELNTFVKLNWTYIQILGSIQNELNDFP
jgi:hypothetical protein